MAPIHGVPTTLCERKPLRVHQLGNLTRVAAPLTRGRLLHQGDIASWRKRSSPWCWEDQSHA